MDLTRQPPRRPSHAGLAGIVGLARMADKARAHKLELIGEFVYGQNSGLDRQILAFVNMSAVEFADLAGELDDEELGACVLERAARSPAQIEAFNREHLERLPQDDRHRQLLAERVARYAPERTDIQTVFASIELDDWGAFRTVDLTRRPPRTPYLRSVAGVAAAARMADKARATRSGLAGDYKYGNDSGVDQQVLAFLGIAAEDFLQAAWENANDLELGEWVRARAQRTDAQICAFNAALSSRGKHPPLRERFLQRRAEICPECSFVETWFDLLDVDDQQSFGVVDLTRRPPRSPYDRSVGGICGLARMIDKGRAHQAGLLGLYWYGEDSGADRAVLAFLGLGASEFVAALGEHPTDLSVAAWLGSRLDRSEADKEEFCRATEQAGPESVALQAYLRRQVARLDPGRKDIQSWCALTQLDDQVTFARLRAGV
jgi:hypothetical protein